MLGISHSAAVTLEVELVEELVELSYYFFTPSYARKEKIVSPPALLSLVVLLLPLLLLSNDLQPEPATITDNAEEDEDVQ